MAKTYITFGSNHVHKINGTCFDCNCVAVINCDNQQDGRKKAFEYFGPVFSFEYHENEFDMDSMKYFPRGLIEIKEN